MARLPLVLLALAALSACGSRPPPAYRTVATAAFVAPDRIEVQVRDAAALDGAELVAPDGRGWTADTIDVQTIQGRQATFGKPQFGVSVEGASGSGVTPGLSIGIPVNGLFGAPRPPAVIDSAASIRIGDLATYRAGFAEWKIKLRLGRPDDDPRYVMLPAPAPDSAGQ
jgi:hypothetical protein